MKIFVPALLVKKILLGALCLICCLGLAGVANGQSGSEVILDDEELVVVEETIEDSSEIVEELEEIADDAIEEIELDVDDDEESDDSEDTNRIESLTKGLESVLSNRSDKSNGVSHLVLQALLDGESPSEIVKAHHVEIKAESAAKRVEQKELREETKAEKKAINNVDKPANKPDIDSSAKKDISLKAKPQTNSQAKPK